MKHALSRSDAEVLAQIREAIREVEILPPGVTGTNVDIMVVARLVAGGYLDGGMVTAKGERAIADHIAARAAKKDCR